MECVVALSVLAAMLSVVLSIQVVQSARIGLARQKLVAEQTLSNLAQRVVAAEPAQLTQETIDGWAQQQVQDQGLLPETIQVDVIPVVEPTTGQRIVLTWKPKSPHLPEYSLVTWRFQQSPVPETEEQP